MAGCGPTSGAGRPQLQGVLEVPSASIELDDTLVNLSISFHQKYYIKAKKLVFIRRIKYLFLNVLPFHPVPVDLFLHFLSFLPL